jgi:hypothetical protein
MFGSPQIPSGSVAAWLRGGLQKFLKKDWNQSPRRPFEKNGRGLSPQ